VVWLLLLPHKHSLEEKEDGEDAGVIAMNGVV